MLCVRAVRSPAGDARRRVGGGDIERRRKNLRYVSRNFRSREGRPSGLSPMVSALLLLLAASSPSAGFALANTPGTQSDFANRIATIEARTGGRIGAAALDTATRQ